MIYLTSDLHIGHNKEFIYKPRGFNSIFEHDQALIKNWNEMINHDDEVYILGDIMLGDNEYGRKIFNQLKGKKHIILGNHDYTDSRLKLYPTLRGVIDVKWADMLKYKNYHFFMSHWFAETSSLEKDNLKKCIINLFAHTHQKEKFHNEIPWQYNVGLNAHNMRPVSIDEVIADCESKREECLKLL